MALFDKLVNNAKKVSGQATSAVNEMLAKAGGASENSYDLSGAVNLRESVPQRTDGAAPLIKTAQKEAGSARSLMLFGERIEISPAQDVYNTYRKIFVGLARDCSEQEKREFREQVHDYISFVEKFPQIYDNNLYPLIKYAVDALILENVWSVTLEGFSAQQKEKHHYAIDYYDMAITAGSSAASANSEVVSGVGSSIAGKLGAKYTGVSSDVFDGIAGRLIDTVAGKAGISEEQQKKIYSALDQEALQKAVLADYTLVCASLMELLVENGMEIQYPGEEVRESAKAVFQNLSSPGFPQEKMKEAFIRVLRQYPYNPDYFKFIAGKFGATEEIKSAADYFGFPIE